MVGARSTRERGPRDTLRASQREDAISTSANESDPYKAAGVDIAKGNAFVDSIGDAVAGTNRPGVVTGIGGFGAMFDPRAAGFDDPILVAATDGVGTKLRIAIESGRHDTVGIDLVAMCVNDLAVQGAEPLFFLDYLASAKLDPEAAGAVVAGIAAACRTVGCALIGGETAEMPGMYAAGDYDLAGFAVGAVERGQQVTGEQIAAGDVVLGLASSGAHSNGFSLIRKIVAEAGLDYADRAPFAPGLSLAEALLTPTRLYPPAMIALTRGGLAKGFAHITGGGLSENIPRVLPEGLGVSLDAARWPLPPVFGWLKARAGLSDADLARTFNCGIGMVAIVAEGDTDAAAGLMAGHGETVHRIGTVVSADRQAVSIENTRSAWAVEPTGPA